MSNIPKKLIYWIGGILVVIILITSSYFTVEQNEIGVVSRFGKFQNTASPGLNFLIPFINSYTKYRTDLQQITSFDLNPKDLMNTYSSDNQEIDVAWSVFFRIPIDRIEFIYEHNRDYIGKMTTLVIDRVKSGFGHVNVQVVAERRDDVRKGIQAVLKRDADETLGLEVADFQLPDLQYGKLFREAINNAAVKKAGIESQEYEQQQQKKVAETKRITAEGEANAVRAKAEGDAAAIRLNADANAHRVEVAGLAEAKAIKAQADALSTSPQLVEWKKAGQGWDGHLPTHMFAGAPVPLMSFAPRGNFYGGAVPQSKTP